MKIFNPPTFSIDWEVMVIDDLLRVVQMPKIYGLAGELARELDLPVHIDWACIEFGLGINYSYGEFVDRLNKTMDLATQVMAERGLSLFSSATHPNEFYFYGTHVHVGTLHDESAAIRLENALMKYMPVLGALSANSPIYRGSDSGYKSSRIWLRAHWAIGPNQPSDPEVSSFVFSQDLLAKTFKSPTLEVRVPDCASSFRILAALSLFSAALVQRAAEESSGDGADEWIRKNNVNLLANRWAAARYGMQATLFWDGAERPVSEILEELLDYCEPALSALGAERSDLAPLETMARKRLCQADYVRELSARYPDPWCLVSVMKSLYSDGGTPIDEYMESSAPLEPVPAVNNEKILAAHLGSIGEMSRPQHLYHIMYMPSAPRDRMLDEMVRRGLLERETADDRGQLLFRRKNAD